MLSSYTLEVQNMQKTCTLNMDISFGNGNSILKLLRGVSHSQIEFGVGIQSK